MKAEASLLLETEGLRILKTDGHRLPMRRLTMAFATAVPETPETPKTLATKHLATVGLIKELKATGATGMTEIDIETMTGIGTEKGTGTGKGKGTGIMNGIEAETTTVGKMEVMTLHRTAGRRPALTCHRRCPETSAARWTRALRHHPCTSPPVQSLQEMRWHMAKRTSR